MSRKCTVCAHEKVDEINRKLLENETPTSLSRQYGVTHQALKRHLDNHLSQQVAYAQQVASDVVSGGVILEDIRWYEKEGKRLKDLAEKEQDYKTALMAIDRCLKCIELRAKIDGIIHEQASVNIFLSDEWRQVGMVLLQALSPFPEARQRVAMALVELEKQKTGRVLPPPRVDECPPPKNDENNQQQ